MWFAMDELDRWRGRVDGQLDGILQRLSLMEDRCIGCRAQVNGKVELARDAMDSKVEAIHARITALQVRLAWWSGGAAVIGGVLGSGVAAGLILSLLG